MDKVLKEIEAMKGDVHESESEEEDEGLY